MILGPYVAHWPADGAQRLKCLARDGISYLQQQFADAVVLSGPTARSRLFAGGKSASQIYTIPFGIDLERFAQLPLPDGAPVILYLGGLSERKGIYVLLSAFDIVASRNPDVHLVVAGGGEERNRVLAATQSSPNRERIRIVGRVTNRDVPKLIGNSTVYCLASLGEPYGMSLIEAMATGRPVVATRSAGPLDIVDARGGILVSPGDPHDMARAIEAILRDPRMASDMGSYNRQAVRNHAWPIVIERLEEVYAAVIARRSRRHDNANGAAVSY